MPLLDSIPPRPDFENSHPNIQYNRTVSTLPSYNIVQWSCLFCGTILIKCVQLEIWSKLRRLEQLIINNATHLHVTKIKCISWTTDPNPINIPECSSTAAEILSWRILTAIQCAIRRHSPLTSSNCNVPSYVIIATVRMSKCGLWTACPQWMFTVAFWSKTNLQPWIVWHVVDRDNQQVGTRQEWHDGKSKYCLLLGTTNNAGTHWSHCPQTIRHLRERHTVLINGSIALETYTVTGQNKHSLQPGRLCYCLWW